MNKMRYMPKLTLLLTWTFVGATLHACDTSSATSPSGGVLAEAAVGTPTAPTDSPTSAAASTPANTPTPTVGASAVNSDSASSAGGATGVAGSASSGTTDNAAGTTDTSTPPSQLTTGNDSEALFALSDPARNQVQAGQVCERLATLQCAGQAHCCPQPSTDFEACRVKALQGCREGSHLDTISSDPGTGFDAAAANVRLQAYEEKALACDPSVAAWADSAAGLRGMMQGTVASGASCAPQGLSTSSAAAALAYCQAPDEVSCLPDPTFLTWTCTGRAGPSGSCLTDLNCQSGLFCPQADYLSPVHSQCTLRRDLGQSCISPNECQSAACQGGSCVDATVEAVYCFD